MGKLEYLDALKRAMAGIAPELQAKTLAYYEQRFVDGMAAGRGASDISKDLGDPKKIAMSLRASVHLSAFGQQPHRASLPRRLVSALGLAIVNLFMVLPAAVCAALLAALYAGAFALYVAGIAITASGLSGAHELVLNGPLRHFVIDDDDLFDSNSRTKVSIGEHGIRAFQEPDPQAATDNDAVAPVIRRAEAVAGHGLHITTELDAGSRTTQSVLGLGIVLAAILLFLLSLVVTKYAAIGVKRYVQMNFSLLKGA